MLWIIATIYVIGSIALGAIEYDQEQEFGSNRYEALGRALLITLFWPLFRVVEAWRTYR